MSTVVAIMHGCIAPRMMHSRLVGRSVPVCTTYVTSVCIMIVGVV